MISFHNIKVNMRRHSKKVDLVVDTLAVEAGQRSEVHLHVGTMEDGTPIRLPVVLINGIHPGTTLYVQAVSDGDELNGIAVIHELLRTIRPDESQRQNHSRAHRGIFTPFTRGKPSVRLMT